ncbi:MAG: type II toxin-antitoxin system prevent-host-death family antitoxin [Pseudomonadota bacterium]
MLITPQPGHTILRSTTEARDQLSALIDWVNRPDGKVILTRHGRKVAALVSIHDMTRIMSEAEMDATIEKIKTGDPHQLPGTFSVINWRLSGRESAEKIRRAQLSRAKERSILAKNGLEPVPGGEVEVVVEEKVRRKRWWRLALKPWL